MSKVYPVRSKSFGHLLLLGSTITLLSVAYLLTWSSSVQHNVLSLSPDRPYLNGVIQHGHRLHTKTGWLIQQSNLNARNHAQKLTPVKSVTSNNGDPQLTNDTFYSKIPVKDIDTFHNHSDLSIGHQNMSAPTSLVTQAKRIVSAFRHSIKEPHLVNNQSFFTSKKAVINRPPPAWLVQPSPCPFESQSILLLVVIPSAPKHRKQRKAIRDTWASPVYGHSWPGVSRAWNDSVKIIFFLGLSKAYSQENVVSEADEFKDIVVGNFSDTYRNLGLKMANVLHWTAAHCSTARHVIKVDDDTFVHIPLLLQVLDSFSVLNSSFVLGRMQTRKTPRVKRYGRWNINNDDYPLYFWPRYMYGHSYVMSGSAVPRLLHACRRSPVIPIEDVYITGVLAKMAGVKRISSHRFASPRHSIDRRWCDLVTGKDVSQTGFKNTANIYRVWNMIKDGNCTIQHSF